MTTRHIPKSLRAGCKPRKESAPRDKTLVPYQARSVQEILDHVEDLLDAPDQRLRTTVLDAPTGSGKTSIVLTAACKLVEIGRFAAVLVLTPQGDIREAFKTSIGHVEVPGAGNQESWSVDGRRACFQAGKQRSRWVQKITKHLQDPRRGLKNSILVATHGAGTAFFKEGLPDGVDWSRILVVIDEAHHVAVDYKDGDDAVDDEEAPFRETALGRLALAVQEMGASVLMATATPYRRSNRETIYPPDARLVMVTYAEYAEERKAPRYLEMDLIGPHQEGGLRDMIVKTEKQFYGEGTARYEGASGILSEDDAARLAELIIKDGTIDGEMCSKSIVRLTRIKKTRNVEVLTAALERAAAPVWKKSRPFKVVDGTGHDGSAFREALAHEQTVTDFDDSKTDVLIVCGRGVEGTDWPLCSHYYYIGIAGTVQVMIQMGGRTRRSKENIKGYPAAFKDRSRLVMFAPNLAEKIVSKIREKWHAGTLLAACFMHSQEVAREFFEHVNLHIRTESRRAFEGTPREWVRLMSRINHALPKDVDTARAARWISEIEMKFLAQEGREPTVADVVKVLDRDAEHSGGERLAATLLCLSRLEEAKVHVDKDVQDAVRQLARHWAQKTSRGKEPREINTFLAEALRGVARKHDGITSVRFKEQLEVMSRIDATKDSEEIAQDLRKHVMEMPPYAQVERVLVHWYKTHPMSRRIYGDLSRHFGRPKGSYTVSTLKRHLQHGSGGKRMEGQPAHIQSLADALRSLML